MTKATAEVGSTANRYEILAKLATGGMAEIFLARGASSAGVERHVVLKRILRNRASDAHFVQMFLDEARLAAQLHHPNVAQVYDIGRLGDSYFFTMEYVHGETVRALLHRAHALRKSVPIGCVLSVIAGAAAGLQHAHDRIGMDGRPLGIVHRDVSPSNLMISYEGGVKVVDFGVAKAADKMSETRAGTVKGKISYLSPEQCRGMPLDRRGDLFSLGIVMWEMLTTERLFRRNSDFDTMSAIVLDPVPPPSTRRREITPEVDAIVLRLMAQRPDDRFQTGDELIEAIEQVASAAGMILSASALGRLLRELFGQRPEPWLEIALDGDRVPEGVTVTGEPIPAELALPAVAAMDVELHKLPDLSTVRAESASASSAEVDGSASASMSIPMASASMPVRSRAIPRHEQPTLAMASADIPVSSGFPQTLQGAAPAPPVTFAPALPTFPVVERSRSGPSYDPPERRRSVAMMVLVAGATIGIVVGVVLVVVASMGDSSSGTKGSDAARAVDAPAAKLDAAMDAAVAVVSIDAAPAPAADAASAEDDAEMLEPPAPPTLAELVTASRFADAFAQCTELTARVSGDTAIECAIASCKSRHEPDARKYLAAVATSRRDRERIYAACPALEPHPATPPPHHPDAGTVDCRVDPLACQH